MKIYTKTGDEGKTGLLGNVRVEKDCRRIEAYGTVDEASAAIGIVLAHLPQSAQEAKPWLNGIQSDLLIIGTLLATPASDPKRRADLPAHRIGALENQIDQMEAALKPLTNFILPQGVLAAAPRMRRAAFAVGRSVVSSPWRMKSAWIKPSSCILTAYRIFCSCSRAGSMRRTAVRK